MRYIFALLGAFVVAPFLVHDDASRLHAVTGTVADWQPDRWISVANDQTDPGGLRIALCDADYEGDRGAIRPGVRVAVRYRFLGERYPVAAEVRVLVNSTTN